MRDAVAAGMQTSLRTGLCLAGLALAFAPACGDNDSDNDNDNDDDDDNGNVGDDADAAVEEGEMRGGERADMPDEELRG